LMYFISKNITKIQQTVQKARIINTHGLNMDGGIFLQWTTNCSSSSFIAEKIVFQFLSLAKKILMGKIFLMDFLH